MKAVLFWLGVAAASWFIAGSVLDLVGVYDLGVGPK